ncbi:ATP-binding protein [Phaeacidiphilus oryzae]|uniref:ATP-binding protein n=1 Tax=Phaeacidiphilus oryzae TaxID=348818 RepID=UPI00069168F0|nr:AAA family ATPase [Phaeacidiphilus oryzae]
MDVERSEAAVALLERETELGTIRESLAALASGSAAGRLLVFTGGAGLGKTRLLGELRRSAADTGCTVLSARGGEQEQRLAFHVVRSLLQPLLAAAGEAERRALLGSWYDIVGPAVGLGPALAVVGGTGSAAVAAPDPQGVRDGLDWVFTNLAVSRGPLLVIVDDAHWADAHSLAWLAAFASRVEGLPLMLAVAYRPDELPAEAEAFREMDRRNGIRPLPLSELTPDAVAALVRRVMGEEAEASFCREVWAVTGGNPFETVELVVKAQSRGIAPVARSCPLLRGIGAAVKGQGMVSRLQRLGAAAVRLAWSVAVLGIDTPLTLAGEVAALTPEEAEDAAERLRGARILTGARVLEYVHPLLATAVYRSMPSGVRTAMHGRAAWAVLESGGGPMQAARHLLETRPDGDPTVVAQLRAAASLFMQAGAPESAQSCLARALREPPADQERAEVLYELGCSTLLYDPAATANQLRIALEQPGLPQRLREDIVVRYAQALAHSDHLTEAAEAIAEETHRAESARTRLRLQVWNFMWGAFDAHEPDSPARSRRLAALAERIAAGADRGAPAHSGLAGAYLLGLRAWDAVVRGEPSRTALRYSRLALADGLSWTEQDWSFEIPVLVALSQMYCDLPDRAEELFADGIAEFEEAGWRGAHLAFGHTILGLIRYRRGRLADAESSARSGLELAQRVGARVPVHWYAVGTLIQILLARGRTAEAAGLAERHGFQAPYSRAVTFPDSQAVRGQLLLATGDVAGAIRELAEAGARLDSRAMLNPAWCPWLPTLAEAHAAAGTRDRARELADEAVARAIRFGTSSAHGAALRVRAGLEEGTRRVELLDQAVGLLAASPAAYEHACAVTDLAEALAAEGLRRPAEEQYRKALQLARGCDADPLTSRASRALAG